jgi:Prokaryotic RING finger family 4
MKHAATRAVLLRRRGLLFVEGGGATSVPEDHLKALEVEWAALGHVPSTRLRARLGELSLAELGEVHQWVCDVLARRLGANHVHAPLFRSFPDGIPDDTAQLWMMKFLSHFLQEIDQACLFCGAVGTTHVLDPCLHVVCDRCFDGASYSACPVCEHAVDRASPFFKPAPERQPSAQEKVTLTRLDLGEDPEAQTRALFTAFCDRKQAMSPNDRHDLETIVLDLGATALGWLPEKIPVKENVALVFGTLFTVVDPAVVLPVAERYLETATDVLRFLAVLSGADASLLPKARYTKVGRAYVHQMIHRFPMARLGRPLRRALLALMEGFGEEALTEDMLRHRSFWVWAGEFLHPHEYAKRFPKVARAFQVVRKFAPDGTRAPAFAGFKARLEAAAEARDARAMVKLLRDRPGELGRRLDHVLRVAGQNHRAVDEIVHAFDDVAPRLSTPLLLTLYRFLPSRLRPVARRVYWPKGAVTTGVSAPDERAPLTGDAVRAAMTAVTAELLRRFGEKPALDTVVIDEALRRVMVPFNERTASRSAVALPRGSVVPVPREKIVRMFLHWCQPEKGGTFTDIDLSVGFYTDTWQEAGVCSYYQLKLQDRQGRTIATSGGDMRNAPFPDGASELVDVDWDRALAAGARYAVMVVNNYSGMPFSLLERGFAGLMLRDDVGGLHFDPRTVELKFDLQGENGVYMPLVLDLQAGVLHWLDVYAEGQLIFNNVATSRRAITNICPTLIQYFASGIRPSIYELALLHAASRSRTVLVRGNTVRRFRRREGEEVAAFHARLARGEGGEGATLSVAEGRTLAVLYRGDVELPDGTERYVLFPGQVTATMSASDLIS